MKSLSLCTFLSLVCATASVAAERADQRTAAVNAPSAGDSCASHQAPRIALKRRLPASGP